jgi:hypothetical protein
MKKLSKEDLARLAEKVRTEMSSNLNVPETKPVIDQLIKNAGFDPAIEKENSEGLRIGKYGNLPSPEGETPTFSAVSAKVSSYTGFMFQEHPGLFSDRTPEKTTMIDWSWSYVPWYARLLGLLRLPYDLVKFIVTGRLIFIPWPWRW